MGYRSKVYIYCDKKCYEELKETIKTELCPDKLYKNDNNYLIEYEWVKWYEDYPEIETIMAILEELQDDEEKGKFGYLRLGEDYEDVERFSNDEDYTLFPKQELYKNDDMKNMKVVL